MHMSGEELLESIERKRQANRIQLNANQELVVNEAIDWYMNKSSDLFEISGYAGTGKSVVLREIVKRLPLKDSEILPMAYTGQATMVMRQKGFPNAQTAHSSLYMFSLVPKRNKKGQIMVDKRLNTPIMKRFKVRKDPSEFKNIKLIIVDEAWMMPEDIRRDIDRLGIKVIAAGDNGQLPPVEGNPGYLTGTGIHYLTEIMRQNMNSPLVQIAEMARNGIPITPGLYGNQVLVLFDNEITLDMMARAGMILCCTNSDKDAINYIVRNDILHRNSTLPELGDRMICRKNNWDIEDDGYPLVNGLTGVVASPPVLHTDVHGTISINFAADKVTAYYPNLLINTKYINASPDFKKAIKDDKFSNGDLFEYAYASTVHLAQGSEYNSGIYLSTGWRNSSVNAMNYTAITRFKHQMIYALPVKKYW